MIQSMLAHLKKAKQDYAESKRMRNDDVPPAFDRQDTQFGTEMHGVTAEDLERLMPSIESQALRDIVVP